MGMESAVSAQRNAGKTKLIGANYNLRMMNYEFIERITLKFDWRKGDLLDGFYFVCRLMPVRHATFVNFKTTILLLKSRL